MGMRNILLSNCKNGDLLYEDVYNQNGVLLAIKDTFLNEFTIQKLQYLGINKVKVYAQESSLINNQEKEDFKRNYINALEKLTTAAKTLVSGTQFEYENIASVREMVFSMYRKNNVITQCLAEMRSFDDYIHTHCLNTAFYAMLLSRWLRLPQKDCRLAIEAGLLHDIGKLKIPLDILNKPERLTRDEYDVIQRHPAYGFEMLIDISEVKKEVKYAVLMHHERMDRSGYPLKTEPKNIGLIAKIIAVVDVYDAMISERVYKKRMTPFEAFEMYKSIGYSIFDVDLISCFLKNIANCYVDAEVLVKSGEKARIVYIPPQNITNPILEINNRYISMDESEHNKIIAML